MSAGIKIRGGVRAPGDVGVKPSASGKWSADLNTFSVDFNRDEFAKLIAAKGYDVIWEKSAFCPNRPLGALAPRDHDISCSICDGTGFVYYDPQTTQMLMTGIKMTESYYAYGRWDGGSMMVTALPGLRINYWDRLTLQNGRNRYQEIVRRQPNSNTDRLKYEPLCLSYASWVNRAGALQVFALNTDVSIDDNGNVSWSTNRPDAGTFYTISYEYRPRYVVMDLVHQIRESTIGGEHYPFPMQAVAKLDFLIRDEGKDEPQVEPQDPFRSR